MPGSLHSAEKNLPRDGGARLTCNQGSHTRLIFPLFHCPATAMPVSTRSAHGYAPTWPTTRRPHQPPVFDGNPTGALHDGVYGAAIRPYDETA